MVTLRPLRLRCGPGITLVNHTARLTAIFTPKVCHRQRCHDNCKKDPLPLVSWPTNSVVEDIHGLCPGARAPSIPGPLPDSPPAPVTARGYGRCPGVVGDAA